VRQTICRKREQRSDKASAFFADIEEIELAEQNAVVTKVPSLKQVGKDSEFEGMRKLTAILNGYGICPLETPTTNSQEIGSIAMRNFLLSNAF
jgi:hypothetical protein